MSEYTDAKALVYAVQAGHTEGEIVIRSDDLAAWRISKAVLARASPLFGDMLAGISSSPNEIHLTDINRGDLTNFVRAIVEKDPLDIRFTQDIPVLEALIRYDCILSARRLLHDTARDLTAGQLFDCLVLASRLDDFKCACQIIAHGWRFFASRPWPQRPAICLSPLSDHPYNWRTADAEKLQPGWVWALAVAATRCKSRPGSSEDWATADFWKIFFGEFVTAVVQ